MFKLWGEKADNFEETEYTQMRKPVILAVSSCYLKKYSGVYKHLIYALLVCLIWFSFADHVMDIMQVNCSYQPPQQLRIISTLPLRKPLSCLMRTSTPYSYSFLHKFKTN